MLLIPIGYAVIKECLGKTCKECPQNYQTTPVQYICCVCTKHPTKTIVL